MIFGFSLYAMSLLVILVAYFGIELGDLVDGKLSEGGEVYCCQYQK